MTSTMNVVDSVVKKNAISKDKVRESLHMLQPSATDKENLVAAGRILRSTKQQTKKTKAENVIPEETKSNSSNKSKKSIPEDKAVQTARSEKIKIDVKDLTSTAGPSENYWEVLAERRQKTLDAALEKIRTLEEQKTLDNKRIEKLEEENERLKEQKQVYEEMLQETRALVEVLQEMIDGDGNGINNSLDDSTSY